MLRHRVWRRRHAGTWLAAFQLCLSLLSRENKGLSECLQKITSGAACSGSAFWQLIWEVDTCYGIFLCAKVLGSNFRTFPWLSPLVALLAKVQVRVFCAHLCISTSVTSLSPATNRCQGRHQWSTVQWRNMVLYRTVQWCDWWTDVTGRSVDLQAQQRTTWGPFLVRRQVFGVRTKEKLV